MADTPQHHCEKCGGDHPTEACTQGEENLDVVQKQEKAPVDQKESELGEEQQQKERIKAKKEETLESLQNSKAFFSAALGEESHDVPRISSVLRKFEEDRLLPEQSRFMQQLPDTLEEFSKMGRDLSGILEEIGQITSEIENETEAEVVSSGERFLEVEAKLGKMARELEERKHEINSTIQKLSEQANEMGYSEADDIDMAGKQFFASCEQVQEHIKSARNRWTQVSDNYRGLDALRRSLNEKKETVV